MAEQLRLVGIDAFKRAGFLRIIQQGGCRFILAERNLHAPEGRGGRGQFIQLQRHAPDEVGDIRAVLEQRHAGQSHGFVGFRLEVCGGFDKGFAGASIRCPRFGRHFFHGGLRERVFADFKIVEFGECFFTGDIRRGKNRLCFGFDRHLGGQRNHILDFLEDFDGGG